MLSIVPYDVVVHDYAWICPRITLIGADKRYCGEPNAAACEACYADVGGNIEEDIRPSRLRLRSRSLLEGARRVVVPSDGRREPAATFFPRPHLHCDAMGERCAAAADG